MKQKRRAARKQSSSSRPDQEQPTADLGDKESSESDSVSHATPTALTKHSGLGLARFPRAVPNASAKKGLSASEILALSCFIRLRQQRKPSTKDSLKKALFKSWIIFHREGKPATPEPSNPLRDLLKSCATDSLEHSIADWFPLKWLPELSISAANPEIKNKLIFRVLVVPAWCEVLVRKAQARPDKMSLFLRDYSSRVRALERLEGEQRARAGLPGAGKASTLSSGFPDWLNCTPEEASERLKRFDAWRTAALRSFWHFHRHFCADMGLAEPEESLVAFVGFAQPETPLPEELLALLLPPRILNDPKKLKVFTRNFTKPKVLGIESKYNAWVKGHNTEKSTSLGIDCWLIEMWPLVLAEEWVYEDILTMAEHRFRGVLDELNDPKKLWKRCHSKLKLKLAERHRSGGRVVKSRRIKSPLPPLARLAVGIQSIAEDPEHWMHSSIASLR